MKNLHYIIFLCILFYVPVRACAVTDPELRNTPLLYGGMIFKEDLDHDQYKKSVADLEAFLEKATSQPFQIQTFSGNKGRGIYLVLNTKGHVSVSESKTLSRGGSEDFIIKGTKEKLLIVANHPTGLSRGIYTYLDRLGMKWYFPGVNWAYIPVLKNITLSVNEYFSPSFELRDFFGTGGLFPVRGVDKMEDVKKDWDDWKRRNRMGGSVRLGGHYWETFNLAHESELKKHPEYLAQVKGQRVPWSASAKFCISNASLRSLFISDRIKALRQQLEQSQNSYEKIMIPVDPSDGGGHCECDACKRMGTVSDRVFFLANLVAKAASKVSSRAYVNLYAYNEHAAPPSIALEPNVMVQIIPYAFQNIGTPQQMIALWRKKSNTLYLYDYYGIPDWHFEMPLTGRWSTDALMEKIQYWKSTGIKGFLLESSNGIGATGLGLYLMSRLGWNIHENPGTILSEFYAQMFGGGSKEIENYFEKIDRDFREIADVPYLYQALDRTQAEASGSKEVEGRVTLLKSYVHFAVLYYQYKASKDPMADGSWERLMKYNWELYPSMMVHTTRIAQLLLVKAKGHTSLVDKWNLYTGAATGIKNIKWLTDREIDRYVREDKNQYKLLKDFDYIQKPVRYDIIPMQQMGKNAAPKEMTFFTFPDLFIRTSTNGSFKFSIRANPTSAKNESQEVKIFLIDTTSGQTVREESRKITQSWQEISFTQVPQKTFKLFIQNPNWINLSIQPDEWFYLRNIPTHSYPGKLWFFVPEGKTYIYFKNTAATNPVFSGPDGKPVQPEMVNKEGIYKVPVANSGTWWSIDKTELKFLEFYTHPLGFFPHPQYIVKEVPLK